MLGELAPLHDESPPGQPCELANAAFSKAALPPWSGAAAGADFDREKSPSRFLLPLLLLDPPVGVAVLLDDLLLLSRSVRGRRWCSGLAKILCGPAGLLGAEFVWLLAGIEASDGA